MLCYNIKGGATDGCTRPLSLQVTERCGKKVAFYLRVRRVEIYCI